MRATPTVLVLDAGARVNSDLDRALSAGGYSVIRVTEAAKCLAVAGQDHPDLVVLSSPSPGDDHETIRQLRADATLHDMVVMMLAAQGTPPLQVSAALEAGADVALALPMNHGELLAWIRTCLRRKKTTDSLRDSESRLRAIFENEPECVKAVSIDGRLLDMNPAGLRMIEASDGAQVFGQQVVDLVHPDDREAFLSLHRHAVNGGRGRLQFRIVGLRGTERWMDTHSVALRGADGEVSAVLSVTHDMTERKRAEEALQESDTRLKILSMATTDAIWDWDLKSDQVWWSDGMQTLFGFAPDEIEPGRESWTSRIHADDHGRVLGGIQAVLDSSDKSWRDTYRFKCKDGSYATVTDRGFVVRGQDGTAVRMVGGMKDITSRSEADERLRESEARFRELADNLEDVFYTFDPASGRTLYVSPAYEAVWQRTCQSLYDVPLSFREAVHPEDLPIVLAANDRQGMGSATDIEYRIVRPGGDERWVRDRSYPVRNSSGDVDRIVGTARDVTGFKLAGDRVREQASLLDKARDAIIVRDLEHRVTYWNKSAERVYGVSREMAMGRALADFMRMDVEGFEAAFRHAVATGEWTGELQHTNTDGREVIVEGRWTLVRDGEGRPRSILAIETDITARKALERQFLRAQRLESIGTLAGGIAHDLNNVLTPIMLSIELLKENATDGLSLGFLNTIGESAKRGAQMVSQVLSFARGVDGRRVDLDPGGLIAEVETIVRETFPKDILLRIAIEPGVGMLAGDPTQLHQVLINLCVNARDAMPSGGELTISAANVMFGEREAAMNIDAHAGPYVVLRVADSGSGIAPEVVDKIFDPFFTTKDVGKGTGLGLSTSLAIVKGHGGFIQCHSAPGTGTRFEIYLPAHNRKAGREQEARARDLPRGSGQTLLIVDDEASIRQIARHTAEAFGYRVLEASNGAEAVAVFAGHYRSIDLVLVDMMMPVMDGTATIQALRKIHPVIRIVATSGVTTDASVANSAGAGAAHFLPKPYSAESLLRSLSRALTEEADDVAHREG